MAKTTVNHTAKASIQFGYGVEAAEIKQFLSKVPDAAKINVDHWKGDQRDPEQTTITASWDPTEHGEWGSNAGQ